LRRGESGMEALEGVRISVVGVGNIGQILVERLRAAGCNPDRLAAYDTDTTRATEVCRPAGIRPAATLTSPEIARADLLLLAAPPPAVCGIAESLAPQLGSGQTVVSFAAGVRLGWLETTLPSGVGVARVMPNAPSKVGRGFNPVSWGDRVSDEGKARVRAVVDTLGESLEVPEEQLSWWVGLSGATMRSLLPVLEGMADAGVEAGLEPPLARQVAIRLLQGTATLAELDTRPLSDLKRLTPMETLDEPTVRKIFLEAARNARSKVVQLEGKLSTAVGT
jgi:pyrroline-5-carboxylate reductase